MGQTSDANGLKSNTTTSYDNTITFNNDGTVNIISGGAYLRFNSDSGQDRFRYYKSSSYTGRKAICLYKLEETQGTTETLYITGHNYNAVVTEPTCTEDGYTTYTCACGYSYTADTVVKNGHTYDEDVTAPTCGTAGFTTFTCSECEYTYTETGAPATGEHTFDENGNCTGCDATQDAPEEPEEPEVTFDVPEGVDAVVMGDGNILPTASAPDGYTFAGWSEVKIEETTTAPTILKAGSVYEGEADTLYAVYTRTETTAGTSQFEKVTTAPSDWSGQYLIVYEDESFVFDGDLSKLDASNNYEKATINNGVITVTADLTDSIFTIAKNGGNYTIQSASGYYIGHNSNDNKLSSSTTTTYANTLSLNDDKTVNIINAGGSYLRFNTTSGQDRFRYFKSSTYSQQKAICLYKLVETAGTTTTYYATL